jgi:hypothetical protein
MTAKKYGAKAPSHYLKTNAVTTDGRPGWSAAQSGCWCRNHAFSPYSAALHTGYVQRLFWRMRRILGQGRLK